MDRIKVTKGVQPAMNFVFGRNHALWSFFIRQYNID